MQFINLHESWEIEYWTKTFGGTIALLCEVNAKASKNIEKARQYPGK